MDNIVIRYLDHPKLDDPTCIEGLPGIGNVGKLAAEHLKDELKAVKFAEIFSKYFPPQVLVQEDGQVRRGVLARRARRGDCRREWLAPRPGPPVRYERRLPHGRDVRLLRRPEVRAGRARRAHEVPRDRDLLQRTRGEGEADRPDHLEAERHRGRAGASGQARGPRLHWLSAPRNLYTPDGALSRPQGWATTTSGRPF